MKRFICLAPGCYNMVDEPRSFCATHKEQGFEYEAMRKASNAARWERGGGDAYRWVYKDPRWPKCRRDRLALEPLCRACGARATDVDHIIPHKGRAEYAFNQDNLQSLCHECHKAKTRQERGQ
jgi:5-methylcytosine-specific restriction protein A